MQMDKLKLAAGDQGEVLKLARTIKASVPTHENNPVATQFFDGEPSNIRQLDTNTLVASLAGETFNEKVREVEDLVFAQRVREQYPALGAMSKPSVGGDVTRIGRSTAVGSGWMPKAEIVVTSGAKAAGGRLEKTAKLTTASSNILTEQIKTIVHEILGAAAENFDPSTLASKLTSAIKTTRPELRRRLENAVRLAA